MVEGPTAAGCKGVAVKGVGEGLVAVIGGWIPWYTVRSINPRILFAMQRTGSVGRRAAAPLHDGGGGGVAGFSREFIADKFGRGPGAFLAQNRIRLPAKVQKFH